jgi:hypothetical protein
LEALRLGSGRWRGRGLRADGCDFLAEVVKVAMGEGLVDDFVDDGKKVVERADGAKRRSISGATEAAGCGQEKSGLDGGRGQVAMEEVKSKLAIGAASFISASAEQEPKQVDLRANDPNATFKRFFAAGP